jgi:L-seryl-tRNA(Ser) seleniumtransferase
MLDTAPYGLEPEPTVPESLAAGVDVVAFSGDKLLGGPQAGILAGRDDLIAKCKRHPLARAVRPDKLCLAALSATLVPYLRNQATTEIPIWQMIARPLADIAEQANGWATYLAENGVDATAIDGVSTVGGGSLPGTSMPTKLLAIAHPKPDALAAKLRANATPVIARISDSQLLIDPRTILPEQEKGLLRALVG